MIMGECVHSGEPQHTSRGIIAAGNVVVISEAQRIRPGEEAAGDAHGRPGQLVRESRGVHVARTCGGNQLHCRRC